MHDHENNEYIETRERRKKKRNDQERKKKRNDKERKKDEHLINNFRRREKK